MPRTGEFSGYRQVQSMIGKTIKNACIGEDSSGYTLLVVEFTDGTRTSFLEQGQTGYFAEEPI